MIFEKPIEKLKTMVFGSAHDEALARRADLDRNWKARDAEHERCIAALKANPDYQIVERAKAVAEQIVEAERLRGVDQLNYQIQRGQMTHVLPAVADFKRQLFDEIQRTDKERSARGRVERNAAGFARGFLETNYPQIDARIKALRAAIARADALNDLPEQEALAEIERLWAKIPRLTDITTEEIECAAAFVG